jgi:tetratricopeptide (TPR) repeat protein
LTCHLCAAIFVDGGGLLVDPNYVWFGAPHEQYRLLDDLEVIGLYLCQLGEVAANRAAIKLAPDLPLTHFNLALVLAGRGRMAEARGALQEGLKVDPASWLSFCTQAQLDSEDKAWLDAAKHARECLLINPDCSPARLVLARALYARRSLQDALREYRAYLEGETTPEGAAEVRSAIAHINKTLAGR